MPSYAVLGATGNVGQSLLKILLQSPDNQIHAYCRSKEKLVKLLLAVNDNQQVQVFAGNLDDIELLASCLSGTRTAFLAIAQDQSVPTCSIAIETAKVVVAALEKLKAKNERLPKLVVLSSASTDHRLSPGTPKIVLRTLYCAFQSIYDDLCEAEKFLRSKDTLVSTTWVKPGALCHDTQKGHALSTEVAKSPVSFFDLAAGMVEIADDDSGRYDMKGVAVNATADDVAFPWEAPRYIFKGLLIYLFPWTYRFLS